MSDDPMQVSVLTDQVEVQGEKIRDLDRCLAEHREKLNNTEQLFQQVSIPFIVICALCCRLWGYHGVYSLESGTSLILDS